MRAIIIDDESNSRELLSALASKYTPGIEIIAKYDNGFDALKEIHALKPDILFLDIEMPNMNGFDFLEKCTYSDFYLITAQYFMLLAKVSGTLLHHWSNHISKWMMLIVSVTILYIIGSIIFLQSPFLQFGENMRG